MSARIEKVLTAGNAFYGIITPLYYQVRDMGLLNTQWAIILPLIGLFMPFSVVWMRAHFVNMPAERVVRRPQARGGRRACGHCPLVG